ncbi:MAG TPA: RHS repeat-associated core domain-containing protein, partial [Pyrinomonadaceae bacterium]
LTSSVSPEGGASSFAYDAAGDLTRRTDARHVRADYSYDALHRPVGRSYSVEPGHAPPPGYAAAPPVAYFYDGRGMPSQGGAPAPAPAFSAGRLTAVKSSASETIYTEFDPAGRVKGHRQVADPGAASERAYLMEYGYDLAGNLTRQKYPSGKVVATEYDGAGRVAGVRDQAAGSYYAGGAAADPSGRIRYAAHGAAEAVRLGNGLWERASFNARLQTAEIALGSTPADADRLRLSYGYGPADRNNGDVRSQRIEAAGLDVTQVYEYDPVNRLLSAREAPTAGGADTWRQAYTYLDAAGRNGQFGNRRVDASGDPATGQPRTTANVAPQHNPTIDPATNRFDPGQGYGYDAAGNVTQDPAHAYAFDGENRLASVDGGWDGAAGVTFSYDGDGRRVRKASASEVTVFVYDCLGRLAAEYSNRVGHGGALYLTQDPLGSTRVLTDAQGNAHSGGGAAGARHDYLPFGEEIGASTGGRATIQGYSQADDTRQKWHTLERDDETGLDFAQARYYSSAQGRFTGVDPLMASGRASAPQTWNRYSYGYNNPLRFTDPNGMLAGDFYNQDGKRLGTDGVNDGKVYVVPDKAQAKQIEQADKRGGTTQASAVDSAVELPSLNVRTAIGAAVERSNSPTADDQKGGFHEEGLIAGPAVAGGQETVVNAAPGPYTDPGVPGAATIDVTNPANPAQAGILADITVMAHVHPGGELKSASGPGPGGGGMVIGGETITQTANFNQPPSSVDVQIAGARPGGITSIVVGARSKTVYIYNGSGVRATFPLKQFLNVGRK